MTPTHLDQARPVVVYGLLAIFMAVVFVPMAFFRLADDDEGTYLLVSRLVMHGQIPFHDFFYPQMFLLPYVYGAWMKLSLARGCGASSPPCSSRSPASSSVGTHSSRHSCCRRSCSSRRTPFSRPRRGGGGPRAAS